MPLFIAKNQTASALKLLAFIYGLLLFGVAGIFFVKVLPALDIETDLIALLPKSDQRELVQSIEDKIRVDRILAIMQ